MTPFDWFLVAWWSFAAFLTVALVGKPKQPTEPLTAAIMVAIDAALIVVLLITRGVL